MINPFVVRVLEDQVERRTPCLHAGGRVHGPLLLLPQLDVRTEDADEGLVLEVGEQVLLDVALVVLHRRGGQVLGGVPAARVLAEGLQAERRVTPVAAPVHVLGLASGALGFALGRELDRLAVLVDDREVFAGLGLVPAAPVVSTLLRETHVPSPSPRLAGRRSRSGSGGLGEAAGRRAGTWAQQRASRKWEEWAAVRPTPAAAERRGEPRAYG